MTEYLGGLFTENSEIEQYLKNYPKRTEQDVIRISKVDSCEKSVAYLCVDGSLDIESSTTIDLTLLQHLIQTPSTQQKFYVDSPTLNISQDIDNWAS
jgi:hypothetical protein